MPGGEGRLSRATLLKVEEAWRQSNDCESNTLQPQREGGLEEGGRLQLRTSERYSTASHAPLSAHLPQREGEGDGRLSVG